MSFQTFPKGISVQNSNPLLSTVPPMMVLVVPCLEVHGSSPALTLKHFVGSKRKAVTTTYIARPLFGA